MPCCILAAFLFGLLVRSLRKMRGQDPEPVPTIPKPVVAVGTGPDTKVAEARRDELALAR